MKSLYCASFALLVVAIAACGTKSGTSQSSDATEPSATGTAPEAFCEKNCIPDDHDRCMQFATRFSDAFLAAFESCGDVTACIEAKLDAAPRTDRETKFATDYCATCGGGASCAAGFYQHDQPGGALAALSDARLDDIEQKCLSTLKNDAGGGLGADLCAVDFDTCVIPFLEQDAQTGTICRQAVR